MEEKFAAVEEVGDEVEGLWRLECKVKLDDKGMRDLLHDIAFNLCVLYLVGLDNEVLFERLDGVNLSSVLFLGHVDLSEATPPNHLQQLEVFDRQWLLLCRRRATIVENLSARLKAGLG